MKCGVIYKEALWHQKVCVGVDLETSALYSVGKYLRKIYRKEEGKYNIQTSPFLNHEKNYLDMNAFFCSSPMRQKRTV